MSDILKISTDVRPRVESGAVQFDDDWPGVFIRGDEACYFAHLLGMWKQCVERGEPMPGLYAMQLDRLAELLDECNMTKQEPTP
jgi:hypothetical protein